MMSGGGPFGGGGGSRGSFGGGGGTTSTMADANDFKIRVLWSGSYRVAGRGKYSWTVPDLKQAIVDKLVTGKALHSRDSDRAADFVLLMNEGTRDSPEWLELDNDEPFANSERTEIVFKLEYPRSTPLSPQDIPVYEPAIKWQDVHFGTRIVSVKLLPGEGVLDMTIGLLKRLSIEALQNNYPQASDEFAGDMSEFIISVSNRVFDDNELFVNIWGTGDMSEQIEISRVAPSGNGAAAYINPVQRRRDRSSPNAARLHGSGQNSIEPENGLAPQYQQAAHDMQNQTFNQQERLQEIQDVRLAEELERQRLQEIRDVRLAEELERQMQQELEDRNLAAQCEGEG